MNSLSVLYATVKADFLERSRRSSFLVTVCLAIYIGYAVNTGQILIKLGAYRGIYNSAWVGSLMAVVITFFLGILGFYLVKDTIARDERTGVGQILATTPITRLQYLLGKWLSSFAVLAALVAILALAAVLMQLIQREAAQVELWRLFAPFLFVALPMMAVVSALAMLFETIGWLKGGFGNLVYFGVFTGLLFAGVMLPQVPLFDVTGISLIGSDMRAAAAAAFPDYDGAFTLAMISGKPLVSFVWGGVDWKIGLITQRLLYLPVALGLVLAGSLFFDRFDPNHGAAPRRGRKAACAEVLPTEAAESSEARSAMQLTPLTGNRRFHINFLRLAWLECLLLVKGLKWYWLLGLAVLWLGGAAAPLPVYRRMAFMLVSIWPALVWSKMGEREAHYAAEPLLFQSAYPLVRLLLPAWLAGVLVTALAFSGVLLGRAIYAEPLNFVTWTLSVIFISTLALALGVWSRTSKLFEVVYPILWYLGPFNPQNGLAVLDYLGLHTLSPLNSAELPAAGFIGMVLIAAVVGRKLHLTA